jgi:hypothetical protein
MSFQIIALSSTTQPDSSFYVTGVFWLTANSNNIIPLPTFVSAVPFIDQADLVLLQSGQLVEQTFNSGLFPSGTILATVQSTLITQYITAQTNLSSTNPPLSGLIGMSYNGVSWTGSSPFTPYGVNSSTGTLGALNATIQLTLLDGQQSVGMQVEAGTLIGSIIAEGSVDGGTTWNQLLFNLVSAIPALENNKQYGIAWASANAAIAATIVASGGTGLVRVRVFAYTSGSCNITLRASDVNDPTVELFVSTPGTGVTPPAVSVAGAPVTTAAPTYTTGFVNALSLNTSGGLRVDGSGVIQPVSGTIATTQSGGPWTDNISQFGGTNISTGTGVGGAGIPRVTVSNDSNVLVTPPTLTKGTQGATGWSVQDLKDSGRVIKTYVATATAGVTSEALLTLTPYADLVAGATGTSFAVTAGKRLRLQSMVVTWRNNTAAAGGVTIRFRTNASGVAIVSSPVQFAINATTSLATIGSGTTSTFIFPDGFELSGTMQFAVTQLAVTAVVGLELSCIGYEY